MKNAPPFQQSHCLFLYEHPAKQLISALKFNEKLAYGRLLGHLLADKIKHQYAEGTLPDMIIPVPLHRARLRERGFNQAHEIASICARQLAIPMGWRYCRRIKNTPHQIGLDSKTRRRNLRSAFTADAALLPNSIALVDDVMTTGSTLKELARTLMRSGVGEVHAWCVARAARH